jgi:hypothetical protein
MMQSSFLDAVWLMNDFFSLSRFDTLNGERRSKWLNGRVEIPFFFFYLNSADQRDDKSLHISKNEIK